MEADLALTQVIDVHASLVSADEQENARELELA